MKIEKSEFKGKEIYKLIGEQMEAWVCPEDGMNVYGIAFEGQQIIAWDDTRFENGVTYGVPVLYPTPNRSDGLKIHIGEDAYDARMHGVVRRLPFAVTKELCLENEAVLEGSLRWDESQEEFFMFPFHSVLRIRVSIRKNVLNWEYEVENKESEKELPYGIAIHPFFTKNGQDVKISVPVDSYMEMTEEKIPTGKLIPMEETGVELRKPVSVESLDLDHVYTDYHEKEPIRLYYDAFTVEIDATKDFTHVVVFTPKNHFFCVENQTCSTDCFNLYQKGYQKESGLLFVEPNGKKSGKLKFSFVK
ncbi:MAG: aldose 1-epimerase [bacterium]|nr:aldose 1-epimerase [bacterium]